MKINYFLKTFLILLIFGCITTLVSYGSTTSEDLQLKISPSLAILQGVPLVFEVWFVNKAGVDQFNRIQNQKSYGKESNEEITKVKIATPAWKWDDNLKIKIEKILKKKGEIIREEKLTDINWCDYYLFPNEGRKIELIGSGGNVRRTWVIPPDITAKLEPGEYEITAIYDSRSVSDKDIFHGLLIAKSVLYIKKPVSNREKSMVLLDQAEYYGNPLRFGNKYLDEEIKLAKEALRLDPTYYQAHESLAFSYWWGTGELEKAIEEFEIYLEDYLKDPTIPVAECGGKEYEEYRIKRFIKEIKEVLKKREGD
ncbi:MAG: hypothetical protein AB1414_19520 [bacterium]